MASDTVSLSITRAQIKELPSEDLADALEELSGEEQAAVFSLLDSEKAAETLLEAEPRAQRQIIANLRQERARTILTEMSTAQLADLLSVLPHDDKVELLGLLPKDQAAKIETILSEREVTARALMSTGCVTMPKETTVGDALRQLRAVEVRPRHGLLHLHHGRAGPDAAGRGRSPRAGPRRRQRMTLGDLMTAPVVAAEADDLKDDLAELFAKYHYRMIPVVNEKDCLLGVIHYKDIMKGFVPRTRI